MIKTAIERGMRIGRAALLLLNHPGAAPTAPHGMPIRGDLRRRSTRTRVPDLGGLMLLSVVSVLAALLLVAAPASAETFSNTTPVKIPASGTAGPASPYPSSVSVSGMSGPVTDVNVTLHRVGHTLPNEIQILLVSPSGDTVNVMNQNCGSADIEDFTWILDQQAATPMPQSKSCPEFVYRPNASNFTGITWPAPAPPGPHGTSLNDFNNENPNGTWQLYVADSTGSGDVGDIEGGWTLTLSTGPVDVEIPGTGTFGKANPYPATRTISPSSDVIISDLNVTIDGIFHQRPDDLDLLLVGPRGQKVILMSDACGSFDVNAYGWEWTDEAPAPMPDGDNTNRCGTRSHRPADYEPGESLPTPALAGPYSTSLSSFDGTDPSGEWKLFVNDDTVGDTGFFTSRFTLQITTVPKPDTTAPTVASVSPTTKKVSPKANATATFSEAMNEVSVEAPGTFTLKKKGSAKALSATVTYDPATKKATLNPTRKLRSGATYMAKVTTAAKDLAGNALDQDSNTAGNQPKSWRFKVK